VSICTCSWEVNRDCSYNSLYSMNLYTRGKALGHCERLVPGSLFLSEEAVLTPEVGRLLVRKSPWPSCQITRGICVGTIQVGRGQVQSRNRSRLRQSRCCAREPSWACLSLTGCHMCALKRLIPQTQQDLLRRRCQPVSSSGRRPYLMALAFSFEVSG